MFVSEDSEPLANYFFLISDVISVNKISWVSLFCLFVLGLGFNVGLEARSCPNSLGCIVFVRIVLAGVHVLF